MCCGSRRCFYIRHLREPQHERNHIRLRIKGEDDGKKRKNAGGEAQRLRGVGPVRRHRDRCRARQFQLLNVVDARPRRHRAVRRSNPRQCHLSQADKRRCPRARPARLPTPNVVGHLPPAP